MNVSSRAIISAKILMLAICFIMPLNASAQTEQTARSSSNVSIFDAPYLQSGLVRIQKFLQDGNLEQAVSLSEKMIDRYPDEPQFLVIRSVLSLQQKNPSAALAWLQQAAIAGYRDIDRIQNEPALQILHRTAGFSEIVARVRENALQQPAARGKAVPHFLSHRDPIANISEKNVSWDARNGLFLAHFATGGDALNPVTGRKKVDSAFLRLRKLAEQGKAAGNRGDIYDNRDRGHSLLDKDLFPQIAHTKYDSIAKQRNFDMSLNRFILFNQPVIGNASLGVGGQGSLLRLAYQNRRQIQIMQLQYLANHLYVFPAVYDYAPKPEDKFTAHTPFALTSQGKSGSDQPLLQAMAMGLAALPQDVKQKIRAQNLVAPVLQYLIRHAQNHVVDRASYLSAAAHPVAFDGTSIQLDKILDLAQGLTVDTLPLRPDMSLLAEDGGAPVKNALQSGEFTLPNAISRHLIKKGSRKHMRISAALTDRQVSDETQEKPIYHWVLLEGDPDKVRLKTSGDRNVILDASISWRPLGPALNGLPLRSRRTDIGLFAEYQGVISAPSIISIWSVPESE